MFFSLDGSPLKGDSLLEGKWELEHRRMDSAALQSRHNEPSYPGVIGKESRAPEWFSVVRGQAGKKGLIIGKEMDNVVSKCKAVFCLFTNSVQNSHKISL